MNQKNPTTANKILIAALVAAFLMGAVLVSRVAAEGGNAPIPIASPQDYEWTIRDYAHYVGWRLGLCRNPPNVYFAEVVKTIKVVTTQLLDEGEGGSDRADELERPSWLRPRAFDPRSLLTASGVFARFRKRPVIGEGRRKVQRATEPCQIPIDTLPPTSRAACW